MSTDPSDLTAALIHLFCAAVAAAVVCSLLLWFAILQAVRRFRGGVNAAEGDLRSKFEER